jgi:hypothetical protein
MNLKEYIIQQSDKFIKRLECETGIEPIESKDWGWENYLYSSPHFRQTHIERYFHDNLMVLHITIFPHKNNTSPIFGFDLIVLPKSDKISAAFLDYSPTYGSVIWIAPKFKEKYELPDWTDGIFSKHFVACRPDEDEYQPLFDTALNMFDTTLKKLKSDIYITENTDIISKIIDKQNTYCERQWGNKRTLGALKAKIGKERAEYFMKNILFPKIES